MMKNMVAMAFLAFVLLYGSSVVVSKEDTIQRIQKAPHKYSDGTIDGTGAEAGFHSSLQGFEERKTGGGRVSVLTVAWLTLAMAAATGLGALPFFFVELEPQWAGVCNGLAAGVMLAASFDLVQEGQTYGTGNWVVVGTLTGGLFIWFCKKPVVAVPSFLCADAFHKLLPFCTGFAAGCMIWMVIAEVLPDAFKEASPSQVASASIFSVAFMETLSTVLQSFNSGYNSEHSSDLLVLLLFGLGPLLGGIILVIFGLAFCLPQSVLTGMASGIAFLLAAWRPLQLMLSSKMGFFTLSLLIALGAAFFNLSTSGILKVARRKKASVNELSSSVGLSLSALTLQSFFACGAICLHALAEGLPLGVAVSKASGFGQHMVLPVSLRGLPRGAAVASCIFGATGSWRGALAAAALTGFAGPMSAIGAILAGIDYNGLDYWMVFACGVLIPSFDSVFRRSLKLDARRSVYGLVLGLGFATVCLTSTRLVCLHTPYCNSAPEAIT